MPLNLLERLIGFPTVSADTNLALIHWVAEYLDSYGIDSHLTYNDERTKANLYARVGPDRPNGIIASGHTDVVSPTGQTWKSDPFVADFRDQRIYGRGSCDMKGFLAAALSLVPEMTSRDANCPLHLALTFDEEVGCLGVPRLIEALPESARAARLCVVGEPSEMQVIVGHKGAGMYACSVIGREAHGSLAPDGVNAIEYAAQLITEIRRLADRLRAEEPRDPGFDVPYTTIQVNRIEGGLAGNIVAARCRFQIDIRNLPETSRDRLIQEIRDKANTDLLPAMRTVAADAGIEFQSIVELPAFRVDATAPAVLAALGAAGASRCCQAGFSSEAGFYQRLGIPTVVCGPGSIRQAHRPDEYVPVEDLGRCRGMLATLLQVA